MFDINKIKSHFRKKGMEPNLSSSDLDLQLEHITSFLEENGGSHASHLIYLQDKETFWTKDRNALIIYKRIANKLIVLGDPIGAPPTIQGAIKEFCEYSKNKGLKPIFYQISPKYMQHYHDTGYRFIKLGEEGLVNLQQFSIEGKQGAKLRTRLNKFTRNSYTFSVVYPPYSEDLLEEIRQISDSWLGNQKEKGFSVVSFSKEYVSRFPIALLSDSNGRINAFATLATNSKGTISIDLMRKSVECPHGTMDVLFIHIFKWGKDNGYQHCSLGMTPLANVGACPHSLTSEKLIRLAYLYGNAWYNFKGLKEFKGKFSTDWEPRYLAYKKTFLPIAFLQIFMLINAKYKPSQPRIEKKQLFFKKRDSDLIRSS